MQIWRPSDSIGVQLIVELKFIWCFIIEHLNIFIAIFSHAKIMWKCCDARCAKSEKWNGAVAADLRNNGYLIWNFFSNYLFSLFRVCVFCRQQIRFEKLTRTSDKNASKNIQINVYRSVYRFAKANKNHQNLIVNRKTRIEKNKGERERREESLAFAQNTHKKSNTIIV